MARKTVTLVSYEDDLDGKPFVEGDGEAFDVTINGNRFTLDLGAKNAAKFNEALAPWLKVAHPVTVKAASKGADPQAHNIRMHARSIGIEVAGQGRIGAATRQAWVDAGSPAYDADGNPVAV